MQGTEVLEAREGAIREDGRGQLGPGIVPDAHMGPGTGPFHLPVWKTSYFERKWIGTQKDLASVVGKGYTRMHTAVVLPNKLHK